jgi:peptide/nickel transport system substrate-binding protein
MSASRITAGLTAALLALSLAACGGGGSGSRGEDEVKIAIVAEPPTLDPQKIDTGDLKMIETNIYDRLMTRSANGELVPGVADGPPDNIKPDVWRFKIRQGIKFTDDEPLDATAVAFSINRIMSKELNSQLAGSLAGIGEATVVDDYTVDVHTDGPNPVLPSQMNLIAIMPPKATEDGSIAQKPVGSGRYKLEEWQRGDHITLVRNEDYWGEKPEIKRATYVFPADSQARLAGLLAGQYDVIVDVSPDDAARVPKLVQNPGTATLFVNFDSTKGITQDVRVRQALDYAVDTQNLIDTLMDGLGEPAKCQIVAPNWIGYNDSLDPYPYDPDKARDLLQQAGAEGGTLTLFGPSGRYVKDREMLSALADAWRAIGLKVNIDFLPDTQYNQAYYELDTSKYDGYLVQHDNGMLDAGLTLPYYYAPSGSLSYNNIDSIETTFQAANTNLDPEAREQGLEDAIKIGCDNAIMWFGVSTQDLYGVADNVSFTPSPDRLIHLEAMSVD